MRSRLRQLFLQVLGTDDLFDYLDKYDLELHNNVESVLATMPRKSLSRFITAENQHLVSEDAMKFLDRLLR
jgi:casein kinase II subunit alpha